MKNLLLSLVAAMLLSLSAHKAVAQDFGSTIPTVSVNGSAQIKITPDVIYLTINLDESDTKGKDTLQEQRQRMFAALKKCGVDVEKQLSVLDMSSSYFRKRGALAATQYELKLSSAEQVREVFSRLDQAGITNVNVTRTTSSKIDEHRREARQQAIRNAQMRARELAEAVGQSIGACYEISDYTNEARLVGSRVMMKNSVSADMAVEEAAEPNIEFEQIVINYNVSAKFVLNTKQK